MVAIKKTQLAFVGCENEYVWSVVPIKVADIVSILAATDMYYTSIETLTFCTGLNIGRIGHVPDVLADFGCTGWYRVYWPVQKKVIIIIFLYLYLYFLVL